jgi:PAS domain S-box-containing protein
LPKLPSIKRLNTTVEPEAVSPLLANEQRLRMAMDAAKIGTFDWDMITREVYWSPNLEASMGLPPGGFSGTFEAFDRFLHPEDRERVQRAVQRAIETGKDYEVEFRMIRADGTVRWVQTKGRVLFGDDGAPIRMIGIDIDISERKFYEEQLKTAESKYADFYDHAPDMLFSINAKTARVLECNQTACDALGYSKDEIIGREIFSFYHPGCISQARDAFNLFLQTGSIRNLELRLCCRDGRTIDVSLSASAVREGTEIVRSRSICRDITELKRVEKAQRRSDSEAKARAAELEAILDAVPAITFIAHDPACEKMTSSRSAYELLRLPPGTNASKSAPGAHRPNNFRVMRNGKELSANELPVQQAAASGREVRDADLRIQFEDGTYRDIFGHAVPLLDENGKVRGSVGVFVDVTERNKIEDLRSREQMQRSLLEREILAREGERRRLARELHDEAGQTLASLLAGLSVIEKSKDVKEAKRQAKFLRSITSQGIDEIGRIAHGLHPLALEDFGLEVALKHFATEFSKLHEMKVTVSVAGLASRRLPQILEVKVYRITQEALNNARKHAGAKLAKVSLRVNSDGLVLKITDNGRGFDVERFGNNSSGEHLGLQGMKERAAMIGGKLTVRSSKKGTEIRLDVQFGNWKMREVNC